MYHFNIIINLTFLIYGILSRNGSLHPTRPWILPVNHVFLGDFIWRFWKNIDRWMDVSNTNCILLQLYYQLHGSDKIYWRLCALYDHTCLVENFGIWCCLCCAVWIWSSIFLSKLHVEEHSLFLEQINKLCSGLISMGTFVIVYPKETKKCEYTLSL